MSAISQRSAEPSLQRGSVRGEGCFWLNKRERRSLLLFIRGQIRSEQVLCPAAGVLRAVLLPGPESAGLPSISTFSGLYFDAGGRCKAESPEHSASISLQHVIQKKSTAPLWCSLPGSLVPGALPANGLYLLLLSWALFCTEQEQRHSSGHLARHFCRFTAVLGRAGSGLYCACGQVAA